MEEAEAEQEEQEQDDDEAHDAAVAAELGVSPSEMGNISKSLQSLEAEVSNVLV